MLLIFGDPSGFVWGKINPKAKASFDRWRATKDGKKVYDEIAKSSVTVDVDVVPQNTLTTALGEATTYGGGWNQLKYSGQFKDGKFSNVSYGKHLVIGVRQDALDSTDKGALVIAHEGKHIQDMIYHPTRMANDIYNGHCCGSFGSNDINREEHRAYKYMQLIQSEFIEGPMP